MAQNSRLIEERPYICVRCFNDQRLAEWIKEKGQRGNCSWCGARRTFIVHLTVLGDAFRDVADIYAPSDDHHGDWISELLQQDWDIFSEQLLARHGDNVQELVVAILVGDLDPKEAWIDTDYSGLFRSRDPFETTLEEQWEARVAQLLGGEATSEHLPDGEDDGFDPLEYALSENGISFPIDTTLYRARIHLPRHGSDRFSPVDLAAPPLPSARSQRANRAGEPVLYMASDAQTALAEVRAWKRAIVAVGQMRIVRDVSILDLRDPPRIQSPFFDEFLRWRIEANGLLERFGLELSRPMVRGEPETHYSMTQHLCDLVRKASFEGIAYPSAMGPGYNVVLFDPAAAIATDIDYFKVDKIQFTVEAIRAEKIYFVDDQ
jgi:RES domain-containing protein